MGFPLGGVLQWIWWQVLGTAELPGAHWLILDVSTLFRTQNLIGF